MAHVVTIHAQFLEVEFSGVVTPESVAAFGRLTDEEEAALAQLRRVLFMLRDVTEFGFDARELGNRMVGLADRGVRLAFVAGQPLTFGVGRQIAQYSKLEAEAIMVFHSRDEAVQWLVQTDDVRPATPDRQHDGTAT